MALLNRFSKLNDRGETGIFTFIVTKSVTRDLHRDATTKDFCFGYHRWAISFQRPTDKMLGVHLLLRNASPSTACVVDFTLALLNREHFSQNQVYRKRQAKFSITNPMQGVSRWIELSELAERRFSNETGEFLFELSLSNMTTIFECDIQLSSIILNQYKQMLKFGSNTATPTAQTTTTTSGGQHTKTGNASAKGNQSALASASGQNQLINLETNNFTFGSFEWSLTIVPLVVSSGLGPAVNSSGGLAYQNSSSGSSSQDSFSLDQQHHHQTSGGGGAKSGKHQKSRPLANPPPASPQLGQQQQQQLEPVCRVYLNRLSGFDSLCRVKYRVILGHHQPGGAQSAEFVDSKQLDQISDCRGRIRGHQFRHTNVLKLISLRHQQASQAVNQSNQCLQQTLPSTCSTPTGKHSSKQSSGGGGGGGGGGPTLAASSLDLRVHIEMFCANTISEARVPLTRNPNEPQVSNCSDRNKQAWCVESDCDSGELLRLKLFFMDLQSVPRNHIRYISWIAHLVRRDPKTRQTRDSLAVRNSPHSNYYLQDGIDLGATMETDVEVEQLNKSPKSYLENDMLTVHIEWIDSLLLFSHLYNNYDALATVQRHQISRELCALQQEFDYLEGKYLQAQRTLNRLSNGASVEQANNNESPPPTAPAAASNSNNNNSSNNNNNNNGQRSQRGRQQQIGRTQRQQQDATALNLLAAATASDNKHQQRSNGRQSLTLNEQLGGGGVRKDDDDDEQEDERSRLVADSNSAGRHQMQQQQADYETLDLRTVERAAEPSRAQSRSLAGRARSLVGPMSQICLIGEGLNEEQRLLISRNSIAPDDERRHTLTVGYVNGGGGDESTRHQLPPGFQHTFSEQSSIGASNISNTPEAMANAAANANNQNEVTPIGGGIGLELNDDNADRNLSSSVLQQQRQVGLQHNDLELRMLAANRGSMDNNGRCTSSLSLGEHHHQAASGGGGGLKQSQNNYGHHQHQHHFGRLSGGDLSVYGGHLYGGQQNSLQGPRLVSGRLLAQSLGESMGAAMVGQPMAMGHTLKHNHHHLQQQQNQGQSGLEIRRSSSVRRRLPQQPNVVSSFVGGHSQQQQQRPCDRPSSALLPSSDANWLLPNHHYHHYGQRLSTGSFDADRVQHALLSHQQTQPLQLNKNELALNHRRPSPAGQLDQASRVSSSSSSSIRIIGEDEDGSSAHDDVDDVVLNDASNTTTTTTTNSNSSNRGQTLSTVKDVISSNATVPTTTINYNRFHQARHSADSTTVDARLARTCSDHRSSLNTSIREQTTMTSTATTTTMTSLAHSPPAHRGLSPVRADGGRLMNKQTAPGQFYQLEQHINDNNNIELHHLNGRHHEMPMGANFPDELAPMLLPSEANDNSSDRLTSIFASQNISMERATSSHHSSDQHQTSLGASRPNLNEPDRRHQAPDCSGGGGISVLAESEHNNNEFVALPLECLSMEQRQQQQLLIHHRAELASESATQSLGLADFQSIPANNELHLVKGQRPVSGSNRDDEVHSAAPSPASEQQLIRTGMILSGGDVGSLCDKTNLKHKPTLMEHHHHHHQQQPYESANVAPNLSSSQVYDSNWLPATNHLHLRRL